MTTATIRVSVNPRIAKAFKTASNQNRRKLEAIVNLKLLEATRSKESLLKVMEDLNRSAQRRGLTQEILQGLLDD